MGRTDFPPQFFRRQDERDDAQFYRPDRFVQHIDDGAIAAVGNVYAEFGATGRVLDLCASWVSHLQERPEHLTVLGMNRHELEANPMADQVIVHDLNADATIPVADDTVDTAICTVAIDYLTQPVAVLTDLGRVLRPGGAVALTWSNRLFPTKAVHGWLAAAEAQRPEIVRRYLEAAGVYADIDVQRRPTTGTDPLWAATARRS